MYATEEQRKNRASEISRTRTAIGKQIASRLVPPEERERIALTLPGDCMAVLKAWGKRWHKPASATLRALLARHSAAEGKISWIGQPIEMIANLEVAVVARLRTQAVAHKTTPSKLVAEHLARELSCDD